MIYIEYISDVSDYEKYNSNNHEKDPNDAEIKDKDYKTEISKTHLSNCLDVIEYPVEWIYCLTNAESKLLLTVCETGQLVMRRPKIYDDELKERIEDRFNKSWTEGEWFMRMDASSPKDSSVNLPYRSVSDVVNAIVTSKRSYKALGDDVKNKTITKLYFVRYDANWKSEREMRCFIRNRKLTAISQYSWYEYEFFCELTEEELIRIAGEVKTFISHIIDKICDKIGTDDIVMDIYLNDDHTLKIVELNSFGYWLASGSGLFHWLIDKQRLYNTTGDVYFRILKKK